MRVMISRTTNAAHCMKHCPSRGNPERRAASDRLPRFWTNCAVNVERTGPHHPGSGFTDPHNRRLVVRTPIGGSRPLHQRVVRGLRRDWSHSTSRSVISTRAGRWDPPGSFEQDSLSRLLRASQRRGLGTGRVARTARNRSAFEARIRRPSSFRSRCKPH
jgi:hypothetical protein